MSTQLLENRYRILQALGSGGFGETFLAEDTQMPSHRCCVIKKLKPTTRDPQTWEMVKDRFAKEAKILEELGDRNSQIPSLYAYFESDGDFYLIQEWVEGKTLSNIVSESGTFSESSVKELLQALLPVLDYIHNQGIVHRDIKPDNIILREADSTPFLIDFGAVKETMGIARTTSGHSTRSIVIGTPGFMASEQAVGRPMFSSDLYSLGLTAIYLLTGRTPQELETNPHTGEITWRDYAPTISPSLANVLDKAIQSHPKERYKNATEMLQALQTKTQEIPVATVVSNATTASQTVLSNNVNQASSSSPSNSKNNSWLMAVLMGGMIGASVIVGLILTRPSPSSSGVTANSTSETVASPSPSISPSPSPSVIQPNIVGVWEGRYALNPRISTLYINSQSGNNFQGTLVTNGKRGGTYRLAIEGRINPNTQKIYMQEVDVISMPSKGLWYLGSNEGIITEDFRQMSGNGSDPEGNKYDWTFYKKN